MQAKTPAGQRLEGWWIAKRFDSGQTPDFDEMAKVVLNLPEDHPGHPVIALAEAMKAELTMFQADDATWERVARSIVSRLVKMGTFLLQSDEKGES